MKKVLVISVLFATVFSEAWSQDTPPTSNILGGSNATIEDFPHQVYIKVNSSGRFCGGTIIDNRWVLTAAHCVNTGTDLSDVEIKAGTATPYGTDGQVYKCSSIIMHPDFNINNRLEQESDITLLYLSSAIQLSDKVKIANLASTCNTPADLVGIKAVLTGWGPSCLTCTSGYNYTLQKTTLLLISNERARELNLQADTTYKYVYSDVSISFYKEDNQPGNTPTVTIGDSGGPATYYDSNNRAIVIGVAASTYSAFGYYLPSTYVNVRKFYPWIMSEKIKKESSIVGDNIVCSTKSYSVGGGYQAASWASSNPSGLSITDAGVATRNNNFKGEVIITANISTACGTIPLTKTVSVGAPAVEITISEQICTGEMAFFAANASGGSDWLWSSLGEKLMVYPYNRSQGAQYYLIGSFNTVVLSYTEA